MIQIDKKEQSAFIQILFKRFETFKHIHLLEDWSSVLNKLESDQKKLFALHQMEITGGEPALVGVDPQHQSLIFIDTSKESPTGRRSLCYDQQALDERKENKPVGAAMAIAGELGIEMMDEPQYHHWQSVVGPFDLKTSSWLKTPEPIRKKGGAIFGDHRFGRVFVYHNGASSYYAARGFRGIIHL